MKKAFFLISLVVFLFNLSAYSQANNPPQAATDKAPSAQPGVPQPQSPEEAAAYQMLAREIDPDRIIQLGDDFAKTYPDSDFLGYVYALESLAYREKNDYDKTVEMGYKSLKREPNNLAALLNMASILPERLQGTEADNQKKLSEAEQFAQRAVKLIDALPKWDSETEEQQAKRKDSQLSRAHESMGLICLQRRNVAKAQEEYKLAITKREAPDPVLYYRLGEAYVIDRKYDDAIGSFSKASQLGAGTAIKVYADERMEEAKKLKAGANTPSK